MMAQSNAGLKDHPVTLQQKSTTRTSSGAEETTWTDAAQVMASRKDDHGGEDYESNQLVGTGSTTWRIWFRDDINAGDWRLKDDYSGEIYDIESIVMIGRRQELELRTEIKDNT